MGLFKKANFSFKTSLSFWGIYLISISLFAQNREQYREAYIFPSQSQHVHSSSIVELPNGDLLSCWFQGSGERTANDVVVNGSRLKKGSNTWSKPFVLADTPGQPDCNPVLFLDGKGKLYFFWIVVQANSWERSILKYKVSSDFLKSDIPKWEWQDIILLKPGEEFEKTIADKFKELGSRGLAWAEYAPKYETMILEAAKDKSKRETGWMPRIHPTILRDGRILFPLYSDGFNLSLIGISDDRGVTWQHSLPIVGYGNIQPSIVQKKDGSLVAYMRDNGDSPGRILESISTDNGYTWTAAHKSDIVNPGTSVETLVLNNGNWIMVYNDIEAGRYSLVVSVSDDEGKTWKWSKHLEKDDAKEGSYSYPSMIQANNGLIHITYSHHLKGNKTIKHVVFPLEWVRAN